MAAFTFLRKKFSPVKTKQLWNKSSISCFRRLENKIRPGLTGRGCLGQTARLAVWVKGGKLEFNRRRGRKLPFHFVSFCTGLSATFISKKGRQCLAPSWGYRESGVNSWKVGYITKQQVTQVTHKWRKNNSEELARCLVAGHDVIMVSSEEMMDECICMHPYYRCK